MFQEEDYVVLRAGQPEEIRSADEVVTELKHLLENYATELDLPGDVIRQRPGDRPSYLLTNYCELDLGNGQYLQWYAIRLEKN
jgi:hypothetical protein